MADKRKSRSPARLAGISIALCVVVAGLALYVTEWASGNKAAATVAAAAASLTLTVADPEAFVDLLADHGVPRTDREWIEVQQEAHDDLHTMTASQLRALAAERGVRHASRASKAELVELLEADLGTRLPEVLPEEIAS